jgi:NAD(P)H-quinone oxidoreductase subunit 4
MLAMYSGQIGLFSSRDLLLFFLMWELELIPIYLLVSMWGGKNVFTRLQNLFCTRRGAPFFF